MNKKLFRILSLALCAAVMCALPAFAAEVKDAEAPGYLVPVRVWGRLTKLEDGGLLVQNSDENDPYNEIILHGESIRILDAVTGMPLDRELRNGETVYAWVGAAMTLSLPPHATAQIIVANIPEDFAAPQYYEIAKVRPRATIAIYPPPPTTRVDLVTTGGEELTVTDEAELAPYLTKQRITLDALSPGAHILVWKDSSGAVSKVLVFAYQYRGWIAWEPTGEVSVYDRRLPVTGKVVNGQVLLPIRAVAEAADYQVAWVPGRGAVVSRPGDGEVFSALPGSDTIRMPGGETGLSASVIYDSGVTYMAADDLARLLDLFRTY